MKNKKDFSQPCWTCANACGGCSWSQEFEPVPGWKAVPVTIAQNETCPDTFRILYCPQWRPDRRTAKNGGVKK